jgi:hypothetical protein
LTNRPGRHLFWAVLVSVTCTLASGAGRLRAEESPWVDTRQLGPFVCAATFPLDQYEPLFAELPGLQQELVRVLGIAPAAEPVHIYLFADADAHRAYIDEHYPHVPYRRALYIKESGQAGVYAYRHEELAIDLRHECTHALLHANLPYVPLWLDEGLAEYFEMPPSERAFDHPHFDALVWNMRLGMIRSVASLEQLQDLSEMGAFEYRYSWAWVHFMLHGPKAAHQALVSYLADVQQGTASPGELSERLDRTVPSPTERMVQHFKFWRR